MGWVEAARLIDEPREPDAEAAGIHSEIGRGRDGLVDSIDYPDEGCDLHPSCLTCPLPACRYEMPPGRARALGQAAALGRLLEGGMTLDEAAIALGVSRRTVYRLRRIILPAPRAVVTLPVMSLATRSEREKGAFDGR